MNWTARSLHHLDRHRVLLGVQEIPTMGGDAIRRIDDAPGDQTARDDHTR